MRLAEEVDETSLAGRKRQFRTDWEQLAWSI